MRSTIHFALDGTEDDYDYLGELEPGHVAPRIEEKVVLYGDEYRVVDVTHDYPRQHPIASGEIWVSLTPIDGGDDDE